MNNKRWKKVSELSSIFILRLELIIAPTIGYKDLQELFIKLFICLATTFAR